MRRTLKIKTRLFLTVAFVAAMLAASSGVALLRLSAIEQGVQRLMRGDTRLAGEMAQFLLHVGNLVQSERSYFLNASRSRPTGDDLQSWKGAYELASQRLSALEGIPDARPAAVSLRTALRTYEREFTALRARMDVEGPAKIDLAGPDAKPMRDAVDRLERQAGDQLLRYRAQVDAGAAAFQNDVSVSYVGIGAMLIVGLLLVVVVLRFFVYGPVVAEADALTRACDAVAIGDLTSRSTPCSTAP